MSGLKQLKTRINSVTSTMKITNAMKMISVSKLRIAHMELIKAYPYADEINRMVRRLVRSASARQEDLISQGSPEIIPLPLLLKGRHKQDVHLVVCVMSDEGLCGLFNQQIIQRVEEVVDFLNQQKAKEIRLLCFGLKGGEFIKKKFPQLTVHILPRRMSKNISLFMEAERLASGLIDAFYQSSFDVCSVVYTEFKSTAEQSVRVEQLVPMDSFNHKDKWAFLNEKADPFYIQKNALGQKKIRPQASQLFGAIGGQNIRSPLGAIDAQNLLKVSTRLPDSYDYENGDIKILETVLPHAMEASIYKILLDTGASESAFRLMAMENASQNAQEMIHKLEKKYHRQRQELVTKDLIEVVAGSSAQ